jgi:hypothetical protein
MGSNVPYPASNPTIIDHDNEGWRVVVYTNSRRARNPRPTQDLIVTQAQINQELSPIDELLSSGQTPKPPPQNHRRGKHRLATTTFSRSRRTWAEVAAGKPQPSHPGLILLRKIWKQVSPTLIRIGSVLACLIVVRFCLLVFGLWMTGELRNVCVGVGSESPRDKGLGGT